MCKVFFEPAMIGFTEQYPPDDSSGNAILYHKDMHLRPLFENWINDGAKSDLLIVSPWPSELFSTFTKLFHTIEAAGGIVENRDQKLLLIYRRGKWDLPKGKIDKGETKVEAAIREVEEETGIGGLAVIKKLEPTYHLYREKDQRWILKKTYWFAMKTPFLSEAQPQLEEGITKAEWVSSKAALELSVQAFRSIAVVIESFLQQKSQGSMSL